MTNKRIKMDCPFCGCPKDDIQLMIVGSQRKKEGKWVRIQCPNPDCNVEFHGFGVQNMIDRWNRRI